MVHISIKRQTEEELKEAIKDYMRDYHPAGYGTMVRSMGPNAEGGFIAHIIRGDSCD